MVKLLPPNLSVFFHKFNSWLRQAGVPDFQKCINLPVGMEKYETLRSASNLPTQKKKQESFLTLLLRL